MDTSRNPGGLGGPGSLGRQEGTDPSSGYVESRHFGDVQRTQEKILEAYIDDIHKYADAIDIPKIERCFRAMPLILAKENRKFKYSEVEKGATARKYLSSVDWLKDSHLADLAECVNVALPGLAGYVREDWFKLYLSDVGLLCASEELRGQTLPEESNRGDRPFRVAVVVVRGLSPWSS